MIPDVSDVLEEWSVPVLLKTITTTSVDFVETEVVAGETISAVVQPTDMETISKAGLDTSVKHKTFHSTTEIVLDQIIEYKGRDYIIVKDNDWDEYGYSEVVGQWTKKAVVEVTP